MQQTFCNLGIEMERSPQQIIDSVKNTDTNRVNVSKAKKSTKACTKSMINHRVLYKIKFQLSYY